MIMNKQFLFSLLLLSLFACQKNEEKSVACPDFEAKIEEFKASDVSISIKTQEVGGETHYWFHDGANTWDGSEYILNESCDTVCYFCGKCMAPECLDAYDNNAWVVLWEK